MHLVRLESSCFALSLTDRSFDSDGSLLLAAADWHGGRSVWIRAYPLYVSTTGHAVRFHPSPDLAVKYVINAVSSLSIADGFDGKKENAVRFWKRIWMEH